jgi:hypothetical protein
MRTLNFTNYNLYGNAKKTWIITFIFKEFMSFFNKLVLGGVSLLTLVNSRWTW